MSNYLFNVEEAYYFNVCNSNGLGQPKAQD